MDSNPKPFMNGAITSNHDTNGFFTNFLKYLNKDNQLYKLEFNNAELP